MASYLQIENLSKSYGPKILFENIGFNINEGDKIALIAPNGTGKTSLLRILAGKDSSDSGGRVTFLKDIRISFLEQEYDFDPEKSIIDQILSSSHDFISNLDEDSLADYHIRLRKLLTGFSLTDLSAQMKTLSGGEIKRVAISEMLSTDADFYIMDEPTNHLDTDAIEFLENTLSRSRCTLLMVTHDRYFLERVCNCIFEMDHGAIYTYKGDYENYLEKRQERIDNYNAETERVRNVFRRELEWMRSTPCARTGKAKYRKDAFYSLEERASQAYVSKQVDLGDIGTGARLGTKIFNCKDVSFRYGDKVCLKDFTYNFQRYEKVGIVGKNGAGKSTFINILTDNILQNGNGTLTGTIDKGESLKIGYYRQSGITFDEDQTVLETVNDTRLLNRFLFGHDMLNNKIAKLSGGERRRLYLLTVLMQQPNVLIMDEPTNDLDIVTINLLEEYLHEYKGTLIIVSHDRHFLDRLVDHLFVFCGDGVVKDFIGNYTEYRSYIRDYEAARKEAAKKEAAKVTSDRSRCSDSQAPKKSAKLSYKEKRELEALTAEIETLTTEKESLSEKMNSGTLPYDELNAISARFMEVSSSLDEKELRWLELSEKE